MLPLEDLIKLLPQLGVTGVLAVMWWVARSDWKAERAERIRIQSEYNALSEKVTGLGTTSTISIAANTSSMDGLKNGITTLAESIRTLSDFVRGLK